MNRVQIRHHAARLQWSVYNAISCLPVWQLLCLQLRDDRREFRQNIKDFQELLRDPSEVKTAIMLKIRALIFGNRGRPTTKCSEICTESQFYFWWEPWGSLGVPFRFSGFL